MQVLVIKMSVRSFEYRSSETRAVLQRNLSVNCMMWLDAMSMRVSAGNAASSAGRRCRHSRRWKLAQRREPLGSHHGDAAVRQVECLKSGQRSDGEVEVRWVAVRRSILRLCGKSWVLETERDGMYREKDMSGMLRYSSVVSTASVSGMWHAPDGGSQRGRGA